MRFLSHVQRLVFALVLGCSASSVEARGDFIDRVVIDKSSRTMSLLAGEESMKAGDYAQAKWLFREAGLFYEQEGDFEEYSKAFIDAQEAWRLGAVEKVVPRESLVAEAIAIAEKIAAKSSIMVQLAKEALNGIEDGDLEAKYRREQGMTLEAYSYKDSQEARDAFNEKRDVSF